jgi:pantetheine-phosphate adenylyltransferase
VKIKKAIYPGSFDPFTLGHFDILNRALKIFDEITILVSKNDGYLGYNKKIRVIEKYINNMPVKIQKLDKMLVDILKNDGYTASIRGIRSINDFDYEKSMFSANISIDNKFESVFFLSKPHLSHISSSIVKEIIEFDGDISAFVGKEAKSLILEK